MHMRVDYKALGRRIKHWREESGMTQAKLAEEIGLTANYIGYIERSQRTPSLQTLIDICYVFGCTPNDLFEDTLPECTESSEPAKLRQPDSILRNTLTNWLCTDLPDITLTPEAPVDLRALPYLGFVALDEDIRPMAH